MHADPFLIISSYKGCQSCHHVFQLDAYRRGCLHDCVYCFSKESADPQEWNQPQPVPLNVGELLHIFREVFETDRPNRWRWVLEKRVPLRLGGMSDCFLSIDRKYGVALEVLKLLSFYQYPFFIVTRSDLVVSDEYLRHLHPDFASVQLSISSLNEKLTRLLEPGAPSPERRLNAFRALKRAGIRSVARVNPLFPRYPDGYFSGGNSKAGESLVLDYFDMSLIDALADSGAQAVIAGFASMGDTALREVSEKVGVDLGAMMKPELRQKGGFRYSFDEQRAYYTRIRERCHEREMEFTVCYLGAGEAAYFEHRDLWDNSVDCCNLLERVPKYRYDSQGLGKVADDRSLGERVGRKLLSYIFKNLRQ